jgi:hypothetical protein
LHQYIYIPKKKKVKKHTKTNNFIKVLWGNQCKKVVISLGIGRMRFKKNFKK